MALASASLHDGFSWPVFSVSLLSHLFIVSQHKADLESYHHHQSRSGDLTT